MRTTKVLIFWVGSAVPITLAYIRTGAYLSHLIQLEPAVLVFGPVALVSFIYYGPKDILPFLKRLMKGDLNACDIGNIKRIVVAGFLFGAIAFTIGSVKILTNLLDSAAMGRGTATAVLGILYGLLPAAFLWPLTGGRKDVAADAKKTTVLKKTA